MRLALHPAQTINQHFRKSFFSPLCFVPCRENMPGYYSYSLSMPFAACGGHRDMNIILIIIYRTLMRQTAIMPMMLMGIIQ